jgi:hypothetical protein
VRSTGSFFLVADVLGASSAVVARAGRPRRGRPGPPRPRRLRVLVALDDVDAHLGDRRHHVLDLLGRHLVLRQGLVELVIGDVAALLGAAISFLIEASLRSISGASPGGGQRLAARSWRHRRWSSGSGSASSASSASRPPERTRSSGSWPAGRVTKASEWPGASRGRARSRRPDRRALAGGIAVEAQDRRRRPAATAARAALGDRGAHRRDRFARSRRGERDHVHVAFDHDHPVALPRRGRRGEVVQRAALVEQRRIRRIQVFGRVCFRLVEDAPGKGDRPAPRVADREHQPAAEAVVGLLALDLDPQAGLDQHGVIELRERLLERARSSGARPKPNRAPSWHRCRAS